VAGDTFEHNGVERLKVREVAKILGSAGCPVYILPGNHDPLTPGSVWEDSSWSAWPNLHLLTQSAPVEVCGGVLYPCPVLFGDSREDPTAWIRSDGSAVAIGVAHGSVENVAYDQTLPIPRNAATSRGLDYLALGHFHSKTLYADEADALRMAYSGSHEPTAFSEHTSGNVLIVDIPSRGATPQIQTIRTGTLEWLSYRRKIEQAGEIAALAVELDDLPAPEHTLVDCTLHGTLFGSDHEMLGKVIELVEGRFLFGRIDASHLIPDKNGPDWIEHLPPGHLQEAARDLLRRACGELPDPAASASLREFARIWQEVAQ
jgi:DNA repair exonuclease SbcCD nuclease subunit